MKRTRSKRSGFTLVEMLVAVALVLFILGLFAMLMQSAMQGVRDAKGINAVDQKLRNAVTLLKADLRQVYLANAGTRFTPGELFTRRDRIPTAGYFSIYENSRALPQGVDQFGNPVSIDYDDILAMTVARRGDSASEMFYGRANVYGSNANVNGSTIDIGTYLDNLWNSPASRFDVPGNAMVSSRFAEVLYFLRPQGETPTLADIAGDPWVFGDPGGAVRTIPTLPETFTLYRRQLLVLDDDALNRPAVNGRGVGPVLMPGGGSGVSPYNALDVSMTRELTIAGGNLQLAVQGSQNAIHFNTLADLSRREFRYGMQPLIIELPAPFNAEPYQAGANPALYGFRRTLRSYMLSHIDSTAANSNAIPMLHDYYGYRDPSERAAPATTRTNQNGSKLESWVGLPTLQESAHPSYPFWLPPALDVVSPPSVDLTMDTTTGELTAYPSVGQRAGEDVLIRDVVQFDVKVLETLGGYRGLDPAGADDQIALHAAGAGGQVEYHDLTTGGGLYGNPAFPAADVTVSTVMGRRPTFVDLGYGADATNYTTPTGGNDGAAATVNVLTLSNYLFRDVPAPTQPPGFAYNGTVYNYTPGYGSIPGGLLAAPFNFTWPPTTPQSLLLPAAAPADSYLMRGAYSPVSAPFGVPLDVRFWTAGDVNDSDRQSDVYFGPDGKAGIGGLDDITLAGTADDGVFETTPPSFGGTPGEYFAPRSDDLEVDDSFTLPAPLTAANTIFWRRPGVWGPDMMLGERGKYDDGYIPPLLPNNDPDRISKPYPETAATPNFYLSELFAPGSDDNPFVGIPFRLSGQVAANFATIGAKYHPFNLNNLNPRNTYDSWSAAPDLVNEYVPPTVVLPGYKASPVRQEQMYQATSVPPGSPAPPPSVVEKSYIPEPDFRPVPYPRPVKAVQVKIRVLERRTGIVRDATIRHFFTASGTE